jgi:hypothetical protein
MNQIIELLHKLMHGRRVEGLDYSVDRRYISSLPQAKEVASEAARGQSESDNNGV